ncbi:MAG: DUF3310 domain-containing protein [Acidaminococcus intestini]|uniref:DUF3310 domain-containing protein n=1 Tax=Acidaminococcus intestini TaxID=187327 RepID=A0A943EDX8_9FIRM|nr:DUF3310 domain-containing protein [Acidaminococcus intestini]
MFNIGDHVKVDMFERCKDDKGVSYWSEKTFEGIVKQCEWNCEEQMPYYTVAERDTNETHTVAEDSLTKIPNEEVGFLYEIGEEIQYCFEDETPAYYGMVKGRLHEEAEGILFNKYIIDVPPFASNLEVYEDEILGPSKESEEMEEGLSPHYEGSVQPIELMQAQMSHEEFIGFLRGNILKYVSRFGKKDDTTREAKKIVQYAQWLQKTVEGEKIVP